MGSISEDGSPMVWGEYMHPVITEETSNGDPWQRNYYAPPPLKPLVPRKYPLIDIRPLIESPEYSPSEHLKSQGFGIVKHHSHFLDRLAGGDRSEHAITEAYHPEIEDLVRKTTGCKHVFIVNSVFRQGKATPEPFKFPTGRTDVTDAANKDKVGTRMLAGQSNLHLAAPVRSPHMDFTPLGARQEIRSRQKDMYDVAVQAGIIEAEDSIYPNPITKESDLSIAEQYNSNGILGPRYAAFSIWRPLKKVGRDPLTLAPRRKGEVMTVGGELVHHFYLNRIPGAPELRGDYLKEYAMLGVKNEDFQEASDLLNWYYVSEQQPDEVLFIKLFDSAALGANAEHAGAPWHASPEIGDAAKSDEPRESIDIRVVAFW